MAKNVLVLGGGMSGLGVAWRLVEKGIPVEVLEGKPELGGLSATVRRGPYSLDFGPHFLLSERPDLLRKIVGLFDEELPAFRRSAQLYFHGRYYNYPLTARNVLFQMPVSDAILSAASYFWRLFLDLSIKAAWKLPEDPTFEQWARSSFGDYLFRLFFKPYTEQFWQIPTGKLSPDSMPTNTRLSFFKTLKLLFVKDIVKSSMSLVERETTLLLRYPRQGIGVVPEKIAAEVEKGGGRVRRGWHVERLTHLPDGRWAVTATDGKTPHTFEADRVVSTIPVTELFAKLHPAPPDPVLRSAGRLGFLSLIVVYLILPDRPILDSSYLYQLGTPYNRMGDMNKFCPDLCPPDKNMLALEFTCHPGDGLWKASDRELQRMSVRYLERDGTLNRSEIEDVFVLKAPHGYPVYLHGYKPHLHAVREYVHYTRNLDVVGRSGNYQYMDMDQCMAKGFALVDDLERRGLLK
jgi:protoporphyrinogen oxidase